jgi:hypothetical protein
LIGKAVKKVSTGPDLFGDAASEPAHARLDFAAKLAKWTALREMLATTGA